MPDERMLPVPHDSPETDQEILHGLTPKMIAFSRFMALHQNHEKSARLAGLWPAYGHKLAKDPRIQHAIAYYAAVYAEATTYTPDKILHQWSQMASVNLAEMVEEDWSLKAPSQLTPDQQVALTGVEVVEKGGKRYAKATVAKAQALEHLGRLHKMYEQEKSKGEGLSLHISLGQSVSVDGVAQTQHVGHLQITTHQALDEDAPKG